MTDSVNLGRGAEFDRIRSMLHALGKNASGIGDDCAILDVPAGQRLVVSTDTSVENVHFKREWMTFEEVGYRATAAALSDLAAMAATPLGAMLAIAISAEDSDVLEELARGAGKAAAASRTAVVGGDLSSSETLSVTVTVFGSSARPLLRSSARVGDNVYVTGVLGGSQLALTAFLSGKTPEPVARRKFVQPVPRIREAVWLAERGASACIDISDGIVGDLRHIAAASGVGIDLAPGSIPLFKGTTIDAALRSGEEYELCVTAAEKIDTHEFEKAFGLPLTLVGCVIASDKPDVIMSGVHKVFDSFNHFVNDHK